MTGSASLDDSSDISPDNAFNIEEESEPEYSDSDTTDEEDYDEQPRQLPQSQAPKRGLQTRGGQRNVITAKIADQPVSGSTASNVGILTQDNASQYQNLNHLIDVTTAIDSPDFPFTENVGFFIPIPHDANPEFFFILFLTNEVVTFMVNETNCNAKKALNETIIRQRSRYKDWKPSNAVEIKKFIGLLLHMDIVNLPRISDYWPTNFF